MGVYFMGVHVTGVHLTGARFMGAHLVGMRLTGMHLLIAEIVNSRNYLRKLPALKHSGSPLHKNRCHTVGLVEIRLRQSPAEC
jgi:hypothetical protein